MMKSFSSDAVSDVPISQLLKMIGLVKSHSASLSLTGDTNILGEGLRAMRNGGVYVNSVQKKDVDATVESIPLLDNKVLVIRLGKSSFKIVEIMNDEELRV